MSKTYFLKLQLHDAHGKLLSDNFYWLSTKPDTMDWKHRKDTVYTPQADFADLTGLNSLPAAKIVVSKQTLGKKNGENWMSLTIENKGDGVAFMIHPRVTRGKRPLFEPPTHGLRQAQQPQRVGDMTAALADGISESRLGAAERHED